MDVSRRSTIKTIGVAGGLVATSGTAFATGEYDDDKPKREAVEDDKPAEEPVDAAFVRVAHFSPDAPNVDVYVDDAPVLEDVAYGAISPYLELEPGTYTVAITAAGDPDAVVFEDEIAVEAAYYTVAAIGELEAETFRPEILVDADPLPEDGPDAAYVRAAHFSPDAPAVDIWADDAPLVENVSFGDVSEYLAVPAGAYTLSIRPAGDPETDVATFDVELEAGTASTGFAIGYLEPPQDVTDREFTVELAVDGESVGENPDDGSTEKADDKADDQKADEKEAEDKVDDKKEADDQKADEKEVDDKEAEDKVDDKADDHEYDEKEAEEKADDHEYDEKKADDKADAGVKKNAGDEKVSEKADQKPHA